MAIATVAMFAIGVSGQAPSVRWVALAIAASAAALSLVLAKKKSNLVGWYVITVGVLALRLLSED
ncbi:hypothetical protein EDF24_0259 [Curtobacterium sp. PhB130]|uniref:hypothetical protein n=1 Tax=unclassified Curtobacterium TaxID=257496 RepID=UPI000F4C9C93|nr:MULTISPECIES: hypothetical protein [unclassified Curtobacterium]ROP63236.1 hypothetical protein EDF55_1990 [Curtobacterium sp. ZW137]ROS77503.1 hypothetical protein EDF24_0259 [Curtobacterium sp. PhB130]TCK66291.1 hypothetical protein EDF27_1044 [Curtobacterium sp. PhB136]